MTIHCLPPSAIFTPQRYVCILRMCSLAAFYRRNKIIKKLIITLFLCSVVWAKPVTFMMIADVHVCEQPRPQHILGWEELEIRLDNFVEAANSYNPDFVIQLGDLADGLKEGGSGTASETTMINRLNKGKMYLADRIDAPFFNVMGNHEYRDPRWNKENIRLAMDSNFIDTNDTWYAFEMEEFAFIVLNDAYCDTNVNEHKIPQEELDWLETVTQDINKPTFVFMHIPLTEGNGGPYDQTIGQEEALQILQDDPDFQCGFFGHCHHDPNWHTDKIQYDDEGHPFYHINTVNLWDEYYIPPLWTIIKVGDDPPVYRPWPIRRCGDDCWRYEVYMEKY